ncbi:MAG: lactate utilization protein [Solobacterium sp.]|nr:lactate utilization protein [Solobacterium sp.]
MDQHSKTARRQLAGVCVKNLKNNGFAADYFETVPEALAFVQNLIPAGASVGFGGSETLKQTGILDWLYENKDYTVYDRYHTDDVKKVFHQCLMADYYLMSTNALTADGHLYNVDNTGNRVAALAYGPDHVVIIAGTNKIVRNDEAAVNRNEDVAAPANNIRLNMPNPCTEYGRCMHCSRDTTLCNQLVITRRSKPVERIHVILINEELGY